MLYSALGLTHLNTTGPDRGRTEFPKRNVNYDDLPARHTYLQRVVKIFGPSSRYSVSKQVSIISLNVFTRLRERLHSSDYTKHDSKVVERKVGKDFLITTLLENIPGVITTALRPGTIK